MSETKSFASLSGALLARKGQAIPAMRRQNMMALGTVPVSSEALEDLGWNDMGSEPAPTPTGRSGLSPMGPSPVLERPEPVQHVPAPEAPVPVVVQQQRELAEEIAESFGSADPVVEQPSGDDAAVNATVVEQPEVPQFVDAEVVAPTVKPKRLVVSTVRARAGSKAKAAFTLRLDGDRHLQLRLVCALHHRSAQQVVTDALDAFLAKQNIPAEFSNQFNSAAAG